MRAFFTVVHRWLGLFVAGFLIVAGLTGAVTSWDHELDEWLNADILTTDSRGPGRDPLALARAVEAADPRVRVDYLTLAYEEGHTLAFFVSPRTDPTTGRPHRLDHNWVYVDGVTGRIVGHRDSTSVSLSRRSLMPFLRDVHTSLHAPAFWGSDRWGFWLMGTVALVWLVDSFVAMVLTWPRRLRKSSPSAPAPHRPVAGWLARWLPAWTVRWRAGGYKLNFDLHRAGGLWVWLVILVLAFTSFSLNLRREVFFPLLSLVSRTTPGPYETLPMAAPGQAPAPRIGWAEALDIARREAARRGFESPPGGLYFDAAFGFYNVSFFPPGGDDANGGMGLANLYVDAGDGRVLGENVPWKGTVADVFAQLQFPLHSGRILGLPGRILMSVMGVVVAMLSVTGIVIWRRKSRARVSGGRA
ncbi:PepSY domain-containing protein [Xylophilus sp. Kf1]|nr:PepSY domain-containing protein [Xylophilus sp. Kf1]